MEPLRPTSREHLEALAAEYDEAVEADPHIDPFCTRSAWILSFHDAFRPKRRLWLARSGKSFVLLAETRHPSLGSLWEPLENTWGFASPMVGEEAGRLLADGLAAHGRATLLLGIPDPEALLQAIARTAAGRYRYRVLEPTTRYVADLRGGLEAWLAERSSSFRRNLRACERRTIEAGVAFERRAPRLGDAAALYEQVLDIERRSWKGLAGEGADRDPMREFYARMWQRLAVAGQLRVVVAHRGDETVGYLHGALVAGRFRGLQFSFDESVRELGLGNTLQLEILRWLCQEGATAYDLGTRSDYKRSWAPDGLTTSALLLIPVHDGERT